MSLCDFTGWRNTYVVYQENMLCPIIYLHIYSWKILKLSVFMFLLGGGTPQFVILLGGGTCG